MVKRRMTGWLATLICSACALTGANAAVSLPYHNSPTNAVDWTTLNGWSGNATNTNPSGYALFAAAGRTLTLELAAAPTRLSFSLRGYTNAAGTAPASFIVEQSGDNLVWNSTLVADLSDESLSVGTQSFGPYLLQGSTRYVRFTYADRYAYDIGLNNVAVDGPAVPHVVFTDRADGFVVAQDAADEIITAAVANGIGYWFGSPAAEKASWESDNGGTFKVDEPHDVFFIETAATGTFYATANGRGDNFEDVVAGTIHFTVAPAHALDLQVGANGSATARVNGRAATNAPVGARVTILPVPNAGYATDAILLNGAAIAGTTFTMPDEAAVVAVSFREKAPGEPTLILSQYYEGAGENKWIELFNPGAEPVDLAAAGYRLGLWQNAGREGWKAGTAPAIATVLTGTVAAGSTYLVSHGVAKMPSYAVANLASNGMVFNGDDSVVLYTGTAYDFANVVDAFGLTGKTAENCSFVRAAHIRSGLAADVNSNDWLRFEYAAVDAAEEEVPERLGWHSVEQISPPAEPPRLANVGLAPGGIVFEIPTNVTDYTVYGAAGLDAGEPFRWAGSSIVDQCSAELAGNKTRITVPTTLGPQQIIWLSVPGTN